MSPRRSNATWPLPSAKPEEVGMSSERLARIVPTLQKYLDRKMVPNLVTIVARHGQIVHFEAQGNMALDGGNPMGKDALFRLFSMTKAIAGVATMICVEEGILNLDDPVSKFIPAFKDPVVRVLDPKGGPEGGRPPAVTVPTVPAEREVTLRDCLRNTTGFATLRRAPMLYLQEYRDAIDEMAWFPNSAKQPGSVREQVEGQAKLPLAFQPGTEFEYHVGYLALGLALEVATGKTLEEFFQERIFKPLGMKDSSFYPPKSKLNRFPICYRPSRRGGDWKLSVFERPEESEKVKGPKTFFGAGGDRGGVVSTAADYVRFAQMLSNGGELDGVRILGRKTVELMTSCHTGPDVHVTMAGAGFGFGMGVGVFEGGGVPRLRSVGTFGWGGAAGTMFFVDPWEDLVAACFTQVMMHRTWPDNNYLEDFEQLVYQALT